MGKGCASWSHQLASQTLHFSLQLCAELRTDASKTGGDRALQGCAWKVMQFVFPGQPFIDSTTGLFMKCSLACVYMWPSVCQTFSCILAACRFHPQGVHSQGEINVSGKTVYGVRNTYSCLSVGTVPSRSFPFFRVFLVQHGGKHL